MPTISFKYRRQVIKMGHKKFKKFEILIAEGSSFLKFDFCDFTGLYLTMIGFNFVNTHIAITTDRPSAEINGCVRSISSDRKTPFL